MKPYRWVIILFLSLFLLSCAKARTYSLYLRYQPSKEFPSLQQKVGSTLSIIPFKDERPDPLYIGIHTPLRGVSSYFKSEPFPLEKAIKDPLVEVLSRQGVKIIPVSHWDGEPKSLRDMETDSILMIEIKKFWTEGKAVTFKTNVKTSIHFVIHLGVKKEGREGNLLFKAKSEEGFLDDLATCAYVVCGGGHSMISEALYFGKPVISFPIKGAFEQYINALYLERLGYGRCFTGPYLQPEIIPQFESRLEDFRDRIRQTNFCGNETIFGQVEQFIREKRFSPR